MEGRGCRRRHGRGRVFAPSRSWRRPRTMSWGLRPSRLAKSRADIALCRARPRQNWVDMSDPADRYGRREAHGRAGHRRRRNRGPRLPRKLHRDRRPPRYRARSGLSPSSSSSHCDLTVRCVLCQKIPGSVSICKKRIQVSGSCTDHTAVEHRIYVIRAAFKRSHLKATVRLAGI